MIDFIDLQKVLAEDLLINYTSSWATFPQYYFETRSGLISTCLANLPGNKIAIGYDLPDQNLLTQIRKSLLFSDHVIIRHKSILGQPQHFVDLTASFLKQEEIPNLRNLIKELETQPQLPYFGGSQVPIDEAHKFLKWLNNEGKGWLTNGLITYAPILPSEHLEIACSTQGLNLNQFFRQAKVLPQASERINTKIAKAIQLIEIPYLENIEPELLIKIKNDNSIELQNFQACLLDAFDQIEKQDDDDNFKREVNIIFQDIVQPGINEVNKKIKQAKEMRSLKIAGVFAETSVIGFSFWIGAPAWAAVAAISKPIWDFANVLINHHKNLVSLKEQPMYILSKFEENEMITK